MNILLVEDEPKVADFIKKGLKEQLYNVDVAYDGLFGERMALENEYDLVILDVILPGINGIEVCLRIRKYKTDLPILILTALGATKDKVTGLEAGADDYLVKPFSAKELIAVVDANIKINAARRSAQQTLEEEVRKRTEELNQSNIALQQSNDDLQQFAHVASHDLKEPLRKIKIFSGRLRDDPETGLSDKGKGYLEKIHGAIDRMMVMVEGVLAYSIVNAEEQKIEKVDLNEVLENIGRDLELLIADKEALIRYGRMPVIEGASVLIYQLMYNIISNSLKFSPADRRPEIDIISTPVQLEGADAVRIDVSDNGIGFAQHAAAGIFATFSRLHSKDKYEGTGLGLALAKRIVERHAGQISARGEPGKGAIFMILLPVHQTKTTI